MINVTHGSQGLTPPGCYHHPQIDRLQAWLPMWLSFTTPANADVRDGSGRSPGGGNGSLLQLSRLENSRGTWWATVHGASKSQIRLKQLSMHSVLPVKELAGHEKTDRIFQ